MKKAKLVVGAAVGFLVGSRAGRGPYERVQSQAKELRREADVQAAFEDVKEAIHGTGVHSTVTP